jgi:hypothetical protein
MKRLLLLSAAAVCIAAAAPRAAHATFTGTLYPTYFDVHRVAKVNVVGGLVSGAPVDIAALPGSDGVTCAPNQGGLLVGGQLSNNVYKVDPATGTFVQLNSNVPDALAGAFHLAVNPAGTQVWTGAFYSPNVGWVDYNTGATHSFAVTGLDNGVVTGLMFAPNGDLFVSDAPEQGGGSVYFLNTTTFAATKVFTSPKTAHGLTFDPYTHHLLTDGADQIDEVALNGAAPATLIRSWSAGSLVGTGSLAHLDQGFSDGLGNYFVGSNAGPLLYLDLTAASPAPVVSGDLGLGLDDVTGCLAAPPPPPPTCTDRALSWGFWKHQCGGPGFHQVSADSMNKLFAAVSAGGSKVFGKGGCFTAGCDLFNSKSTSMQVKAAQQYLALLLNKGAGLVCDPLKVTCSGCGAKPVVVGDAIARIDTSLCKPGKSTLYYSALNDLAECINTSAESGPTGPRLYGDQQGAPTALRFQVQPLGGNPVVLGRGSVRFLISVPGVGIARMGIYDAAGRLVAQPLRDRAVAGETTVSWDGSTLQGTRPAAGTYFYRVTMGGQALTGRFTIIE